MKSPLNWQAVPSRKDAWKKQVFIGVSSTLRHGKLRMASQTAECHSYESLRGQVHQYVKPVTILRGGKHLPLCTCPEGMVV